MNGNRFGRLFQVTTYGESHGKAMGVTVSGCPAGIELDEEEVQAELDRRKPGQSMITTSRGEPDDVTINSGTQDGYTTGTPIGMVIENKDARSGKYEPFVTAPRPSHGDYTYSAKFGTRNWGGGGRSSARETVNWVAAGAIAKQVLDQSEYDIRIKAHVNQVGDIRAPEVSFEEMLEHTEDNEVRCAHPETAEEMRDAIDQYQQEGDSIGGSIYFECRGVPRGLGAPRFDSFPSRLGRAMFAIPATTAFQFGKGRDARTMRGTERNEDWEFDDGDSHPRPSARRATPFPSATTTAACRAGSRPANRSTARQRGTHRRASRRNRRPPTGRQRSERTCRSSAATIRC